MKSIKDLGFIKKAYYGLSSFLKIFYVPFKIKY
jgi:hypothetical protein